jgi:hypothetical protein
MAISKYTVGAVLVFLLVGCNLLQSKEDACLQSARLEMKDPDSAKVIQNLGDRGQAWMGKEGFWLRYSATNSYGGRVSSNMACEKVDGKWTRSANMERKAILHETNKAYLERLQADTARLNQRIEARRACKTAECRAEINANAGPPDPTGERTLALADAAAGEKAKAVVFEETGPLSGSAQ